MQRKDLWTQGGKDRVGRRDKLRDQHRQTYITICKTDSLGGLSPVLCDKENGWDEGLGGRLKKQGIYIYKELTHVDVQQKLT